VLSCLIVFHIHKNYHRQKIFSISDTFCIDKRVPSFYDRDMNSAGKLTATVSAQPYIGSARCDHAGCRCKAVATVEWEQGGNTIIFNDRCEKHIPRAARHTATPQSATRAKEEQL
jgi:hypothetical protein